MSLQGSVVWVTGASSGIGRSVARLASRNGATVIASARRREPLESLADECGPGADVRVVPMDMTDTEAISLVVEDMLGKVGKVDLVVHAAGIAARDLAIDLPLAVNRQVMETNYFGVVAMTKALLPSMIRDRRGTVAVVSSLTGKLGVPKMSAYAASKHALHGFFDSLRTEVRDSGLQVTLVVAGFINTDIAAKALTGTGRRYGRRMTAHARGMSADECARKILRGILAGREEFLVGGIEVSSVRLLRVSRRLVSALIQNHPVRRTERARQHIGALASSVAVKSGRS